METAVAVWRHSLCEDEGSGYYVEKPDAARLTPRETEVLSLIASGLSSKQVARSLGCKVRTVEQHIANIYRKTGIRGRSEATIYALQLGLLDAGMLRVGPPDDAS